MFDNFTKTQVACMPLIPQPILKDYGLCRKILVPEIKNRANFGTWRELLNVVQYMRASVLGRLKKSPKI